MSDSRALYVLEAALLVVLGFAAAEPLMDPLAIDLRIAIAVGVAYLLVEWFEIELPRGDSSTMSAPVVAVAATSLSPLGTVLSIVVAAVAVRVIGRTWAAGRGVAHEIGRRLISVLVAISTANWLGSIGLQSTSLGFLGGLAAVVVLADFMLGELQTSMLADTPMWRQILGSVRMKGGILAGQASAAVLAATVMPEMGLWALAVLVVLLLVVRQAFASLVSVRRAYQSTIEALARTVEARDPARSGHAERVSELATEVGRQMSLRGQELEQLAYAALLHDLGEVGLDEATEGESPQFSSADMVENVKFLSGVVPILRLACGEGDYRASPAQATIAYVVLAASRADDFAQGHDVQRDTVLLERLSARLPRDSRARIERAFRAASPRLEGTIFAVGADADGP